MKKVTWGIDQEVYDYLKEQATETGLSVQQTANLILKKYRIDIKIAPVEEKRKRGNPDFIKKETSTGGYAKCVCGEVQARGNAWCQRCGRVLVLKKGG